MVIPILLLLLIIIIYFTIRNISFVYLIFASKKYSAKKTKDALKWYERAYNAKHCSNNTKIMYAYLLLREGYITSSEEILRKVLKLNISQLDRTNAVINLSLVLWKKNNIDEAIKQLQELYDSGIKNTLLYQNLGYFLVLKGDYSKALELNLEALDYSNDDLSVLDNLAMNYYFLENYREALEVYKKLIPRNPNFVTVYYYYSKTLLHEKNYEGAIEALNKALNCSFSFLNVITKENIEREITQIKSSYLTASDSLELRQRSINK